MNVIVNRVPVFRRSDSAVEAEFRRKLAAVYPDLATRCGGIECTIETKAPGLVTKWGVWLDAEPKPVYVSFVAPGSWDFPDAIAEFRKLAAMYPSPDYAARAAEAALTSSAL